MPRGDTARAIRAKALAAVAEDDDAGVRQQLHRLTPAELKDLAMDALVLHQWAQSEAKRRAGHAVRVGAEEV